MQVYTSANTSINKKQLPASTKKINWEIFRGKNVLDYGGGKYDNLKDFLKENYNINLFIYDPYNRSEEENEIAQHCNPSLVICNNVLNVINDYQTIQSIITELSINSFYDVPFIISIYEGNKTGVGHKSKNDCWQRNQKIQYYLDYFDWGRCKACIRKGCIVPENSAHLLIPKIIINKRSR